MSNLPGVAALINKHKFRKVVIKWQQHLPGDGSASQVLDAMRPLLALKHLLPDVEIDVAH